MPIFMKLLDISLVLNYWEEYIGAAAHELLEGFLLSDISFVIDFAGYYVLELSQKMLEVFHVFAASEEIFDICYSSNSIVFMVDEDVH